MSNSLSKKLGPLEITKLIPHRYPFLWLDQVEILEIGKRARGYKAVTISENLFQGHFPHMPIFPGVLMAEALAQTGAVLLNYSEYIDDQGSPNNDNTNIHNKKRDFSNEYGFLGKVDLKFLKPVLPGETIILEVFKIGQLNKFFLLNCIARVNDYKVAEGKISVCQPIQNLASS